MNTVYTFDAVIIDANPGAYIKFPYDMQACFGSRKNIPVRCTFDGVAYRGQLANMDGPCIGLLKSIRMQLGKEPGDTVAVTVTYDDAPRELVIPPELSRALAQHPQAEAFFNTLSYTNRKAYVEKIASAKTSTTLLKRLRQAIDSLENQEKKPI